jgi:CO/xanthine dehydrogenase FAD-binding subunit
VEVFRPTSLEQALDMLAQSAADGGRPVTPIAGGTDLLVCWHQQDKDDWRLLDLSLLDELRPFHLTDETLHLGGMTSYWQVIESDEVSAAFPLLVDAAKQVGAIQIQTRGTWAGNIGNGSPAADGVPVMMAYGAVVILQSRDATTEVPLDRYYTGYRQSVRRPDQLITGIRMPRRQRDVQWFFKIAPRYAQAIAKAGLAVVHDSEGWRVVANSVAPVVCRCPHVEQALQAGRTFNTPNEVLAVLEQDIAPIDDLRSTATYRKKALSRVLYYQLAEIVQP